MNGCGRKLTGFDGLTLMPDFMVPDENDIDRALSLVGDSASGRGVLSDYYHRDSFLPGLHLAERTNIDHL